ncbi:uncharacterized protein BDR25DRAFT_378135 [Lindgomyces ingoldianus]|uniref:Uncharacterized protein n=1 Tax=Lindgomyces ingoldianus TaxID=673940 RepID=A0ACB6QGB2_9PLEO|nr:uncharacterized protein BDR25DRAFT_378135 [Lindgomyces ingoldianus]KAF2465926.1 hypothetical protein BDR25DRAFT_378135 [Lindgomyces ingoldianus]
MTAGVRWCAGRMQTCACLVRGGASTSNYRLPGLGFELAQEETDGLGSGDSAVDPDASPKRPLPGILTPQLPVLACPWLCALCKSACHTSTGLERDGPRLARNGRLQHQEVRRDLSRNRRLARSAPTALPARAPVRAQPWWAFWLLPPPALGSRYGVSNVGQP